MVAYYRRKDNSAADGYFAPLDDAESSRRSSGVTINIELSSDGSDCPISEGYSNKRSLHEATNESFTRKGCHPFLCDSNDELHTPEIVSADKSKPLRVVNFTGAEDNDDVGGHDAHPSERGVRIFTGNSHATSATASTYVFASEDEAFCNGIV
jgi:hypothetical protein